MPNGIVYSQVRILAQGPGMLVVIIYEYDVEFPDKMR